WGAPTQADASASPSPSTSTTSALNTNPPHSVLSTQDSAPPSVHLCHYPQPNPALLDTSLNERMAAAQLIVRLGHKLREDSNLRVRQPLAELQFACTPNACG